MIPDVAAPAALMQRGDLLQRAEVWAFGLLCVVLLIGLAVGRRARGDAAARRGPHPHERISALEQRVEGVEGKLNELATKGTVLKVEIAVARVEGRIETLAAQTIANGATVERIEGFLMTAAAQAIMPPQITPPPRRGRDRRTEEAP